jgi:shikimate kinase
MFKKSHEFPLRLSKKSMHIFFIGYMGSGKSSLGKRVAHEMKLPFIDLDKAIELEQKMSIPEIFAKLGDGKFREMEREFLRSLDNTKGALVAVGGGTPCFFDNMERMNQVGLTVYLNRPIAELAHRIENSKKSRPLTDQLTGDALKLFIANHLKEREKYYQQSKIIVNREEQTVNILVDRIQNYLSSENL